MRTDKGLLKDRAGRLYYGAAVVYVGGAYNLVFRRHRDNATLGRVMSWLCGAAYGTYEDMRYKHFWHHVDNGDAVWFAYDEFFERHPQVTRITRALEWPYVPAQDLIMHGVMAIRSFVIPQRRDQRV